MFFMVKLIKAKVKIASAIPLVLGVYCLQCHEALASYYDTLPKGVRNFTYRFVQTGDITGSFNSSGSFKGYNVNANINADSIKGVNNAVDAYLTSLSAADYAAFSLGTFEGNASSKVHAQGFGGGYGVTDKLTVYGFIPFYTAQVNLNVKRTSKGKTATTSDASVIVLENLPDVDVRLIQSLFVNYYNYQPLGTWKANAFGDAELGFLYQVKKWRNAGALISMGAVAPTGRKDNPDILQDIAFGDGQWDAFYEFGGGINLSTDWSLDAWSRVTYQFPYRAIVRQPDSATFPVTKNKGEADIKLGNKYSANTQLNYTISDEFSTGLVYGLEYTEKTDYKSNNPKADAILELDTEKVSHVGRLNLNYSTLSLYNQKKFFLPFGATLAIQSIFAGKNIPKYERADFEIRFFF
jgi:hypothetical protein